jgi:predicted DNA binding CopG/RHH family protein
MARQKISDTRITLRLSFDDMDKIKRVAMSKNLTTTDVIRGQIKKIKH